MENYSPLRYPGGKSALYPAIANIIESNNMKHCIYIEPFAGGANIAWSLLINGIYLKKTTSRTASGEGRIIVDKAPVDTKQGISKSTDWRRYPNANESLTRIKVPVTLDKWEVRPSVKSDNIDIVLRGERKQGVWQVEISVFEEADQLSFFDK